MSQFNELFGALKTPTDTGRSPNEQKPMPPEVALPLDVEKPEVGKRSRPDYRQSTIYIKKQTHRAVKKALLDQELDFSDLVQELLDQWLEANNETSNS